MKGRLGVIALVGGLLACSHAGPTPVTPVASAPRSQAPPERVAAAPAPARDTAPPPTTAPAPQQQPQPAPSRVQAAQRAAVDTAKEQAFLDSLKALPTDSARRLSQATPQAGPPVAPELVRREAASMFTPSASSPAQVARVEMDFASYASHDRVQYWVDFFSGRARWHMERYLERLGRYDSVIRGELEHAGMPRDMIYLAMIESGFNQNARSRVGAVGLWQFMPSTARRYGLTVDGWMDERRDPFVATRAAIRFLSELNDRFGSWYLAAAAYDAGPGKISKGLARGDYEGMSGNDQYFAMAEGHFLRRETRDYVPKLIAAALIAKDPERFGFTDLDVWSPLRYDSVKVDYALGLNVLARMANAPRDDIEDMNPAFFRGITPPDRAVWVRVPRGRGDSVAIRLAALAPKDRVTYVLHVVSRGETLSKIAVRYGVRVEDIKAANRMRSTFLARGQRLVIPTSGSRRWYRAASQYREEDPVRLRRAARHANRSGAGVSRQPARAVTRSPRGTPVRGAHVVKRGESLWAIANQYHTTTAALMQANGLTRRSVLRAGQTIRIPR